MEIAYRRIVELFNDNDHFSDDLIHPDLGTILKKQRKQYENLGLNLTITNTNKDKKRKKPVPTLPMLRSKKAFISLPNTPPKTDGGVKKPKKSEIQVMRTSPMLKLLNTLKSLFSKTKNNPQLNIITGNMKDESPNHWYRNRFEIRCPKTPPKLLISSVNLPSLS